MEVIKKYEMLNIKDIHYNTICFIFLEDYFIKYIMELSKEKSEEENVITILKNNAIFLN